MTEPLALVRLTGNLARVHRDPASGADGRRLVYGGQVVALAQASLGRMFPGIVTTLGWHACEHPGPVFEGDLLEFSAELVDAAPCRGGSVVLFEVTGAPLPSRAPPAALATVGVPSRRNERVSIRFLGNVTKNHRQDHASSSRLGVATSPGAVCPRQS